MSVANEASNLTLILTGGGMRCAWSAGLLCELYAANLLPKMIVAASGNAGTAAYIAAGKAEAIERIWTEHLTGSRFISFLRINRILDVDFLIDDVLKEREPVDWNEVKESSTKILCPVGEGRSKELRVFSNSDLSYEVLRAAKAVPFLYGKEVEIDGRLYRDYQFSLAKLCSLAPRESRIILVDVRPRNEILRTIWKHIMGVRKEKEEIIPQNVTVITPTIQAWPLARSKDTLSRIFEEGRSFVQTRTSLFE